MELDFSDQVAVVTGGASGIGEACAALLAGTGARVIVADRNEAAAQAVGHVPEVDLARGVARANVNENRHVLVPRTKSAESLEQLREPSGSSPARTILRPSAPNTKIDRNYATRRARRVD